ncbi:glycerophosphodiester phosphodiesterase [Paenibacillus periandrae]|uniref:glycerophosphodiester phosphodiesterase n=1 Tax=Paenibacillus periandrae TaxID=1761741 RepID=UPI001F097824|nr:glycerophosphodiester phosphodiesterase family protein [Paenibacillus periandrae]
MVSSIRVKTNRVLNIAHRGASGYAPENTLAAFARAIAMNADYLELDVQLSRDGRLVVIHDQTVDRTSDGTGRVVDLTLEQLREVDAGRWFNEKFTGERIPTLDEVLNLSRGKAGLLIEIKWASMHPGIEHKLADALIAHGLVQSNASAVIVQSFDQQSLKRFHAILPYVPIGVLVENQSDLVTNKLAELAAFADYINPYMDLATKEIVEAIHSQGMKVCLWTVRSPGVVKPLLELGVDGLISDYPDYIRG